MLILDGSLKGVPTFSMTFEYDWPVKQFLLQVLIEKQGAKVCASHTRFFN